MGHDACPDCTSTWLSSLEHFALLLSWVSPRPSPWRTRGPPADMFRRRRDRHLLPCTRDAGVQVCRPWRCDIQSSMFMAGISVWQIRVRLHGGHQPALVWFRTRVRCRRCMRPLLRAHRKQGPILSQLHRTVRTDHRREGYRSLSSAG